MRTDSTERLARVVLAELPTLVGHMVSAALREEGVEVDVIDDHRRLLTDGDQPRADQRIAVVVVPTPEVCQALLKSDPQLRVLTLTAQRRGADLYELRRLGSNVDERAVLAAVRAAIATSSDQRNAP